MQHKSSIFNVKRSRFYWNLTISTSSDFYASSITMFNIVPWKTVFNLSRNKKPRVNCIKYQFHYIHYISSDTWTNRLYVSVIYIIFLFNKWYMKRKKMYIYFVCSYDNEQWYSKSYIYIFANQYLKLIFVCIYFWFCFIIKMIRTIAMSFSLLCKRCNRWPHRELYIEE